MKTAPLAWLVCAALAAASAAGQPQCSLDKHCDDGFFCVLALSACAPCVSCAQYRRRPAPHLTCPRSVLHCGDCLPGYSASASSVDCEAGGEGAGQGAGAAGEGAPLYVWLCACAGALLVLLLLLLLLVYRRKWTGKLVSGLRFTPSDSQRPPRRADVERPLHPAPLPPPPYNPHYRPSSPPAEMHKPYPGFEPALGEARLQNAVLYDPPHYIRPPTYEDVVSDSTEGPEMSDNENTVESPWTPNDTAPTDGVVGSLSEQLREVRERSPARAQPPAKLSRLELEDTDTRSSSPEDASGSRLAPAGASAVAVRAPPPRAGPHRGTPPPGDRGTRSPPPSPPPHRINNITINFQLNNNL